MFIFSKLKLISFADTRPNNHGDVFFGQEDTHSTYIAINIAISLSECPPELRLVFSDILTICINSRPWL